MEHQIVELGPLDFAGLVIECPLNDPSGIKELWERLDARSPEVQGSLGSYGSCWCEREGYFMYIAGHSVDAATELPDDFARRSEPARRYVMVPFHDHVSKMPEAFKAILAGLPEWGYQPTPDYVCLEHYPADWEGEGDVLKCDLYVGLN